MSAVRILVAEDDENDAFFLRRAFAKAGLTGPWRIEADGQQVVDLLLGDGEFADRDRHPLPTHLILDLKLPRRSGLEILETLRATPALASLPAVVLTSSDQERDRGRAEELGVDAYFVKPSSHALLIETVGSLARLWGLPLDARTVPA